MNNVTLKRAGKRTFGALAVALMIGLWAEPAGAQCPYVPLNLIGLCGRTHPHIRNRRHRSASTSQSTGANNCGVIITVTDSGASASSTGAMPYDSSEEYCGVSHGPITLGDDVLVGVVNNSTVPIRAIALNGSGNPVFSFAGSGIDGFVGISNNSADNTGYGGPNAYFTNINAGQTQGLVKFITPILPGGTDYFSLWDDANTPTDCNLLTSSTSISTVPTFMPPPLGPLGSPSITASFTPKTSPASVGISGTASSLQDAATVCGFDNFDWQQTILVIPAPSPYRSVANPGQLMVAPPFRLDPQPGGYIVPNDPGDHSFPYFYDPANTSGDGRNLAQYEIPTAATATTLNFLDRAGDTCLPPQLQGLLDRDCGGKAAPQNSNMAFSTRLVGISAAGQTDLGMGFEWVTNYNGLFGGASALSNSLPPDPGNWAGGVTVLSVQDMSDFQGIAVTTVNGLPVGGVPPAATQTLSDGSACNGQFTGNFTGNITVSAGQDCTFVNGVITGNVTMQGGNLELYEDQISGNVQIQVGNGFVIASYTAISGNLQVQNLPAGAATNYICDATVYGNLQVQNNGPDIQIGSSSPALCGSNEVGGNLEAGNNGGSVSIIADTVGGNLQANNNSGATQVANNTVIGNLQCDNNSSITGGGNAAKQKQGQCAGF